MTPTVEQQRIIDAEGNLVVVAKPGSGKTFVLSEKIRHILPLLNDYEGVIAISFTNKASDELKKRSLKKGLDRKESFFGTIHKFYLSEIILSFGKQLFGLVEKSIEILDIDQADLGEYDARYLKDLASNFDYSSPDDIESLRCLFSSGQIYLNLVEKFAIYIFDNSLSCREYLRSKYQYIIIDEFQDCGQEQFEIFVKLKNLGLTAIAVGDLDQSIYGFTGKSSEYLSNLIDDDAFTTFPLTRNHRCHPSIINYSLSLMSAHVELLNSDDTRVYHRNIPGNEAAIARWIDNCIEQIVQNFQVAKLSDVAILVKGHRTEEIIDQNLTTAHQVIRQSSLEIDMHPASQLFDNLLKFAYDNSSTITEIIEKFISMETLTIRLQKQLKKSFEVVRAELTQPVIDFEMLKENFEGIATILLPNQVYVSSIEILDAVLRNELESYSSRSDNEVQILTLHKSKGLEFDVVFHLDLYEWILPAKGINNGEQYYFSHEQDLNLHYVGVTRARKACILCTSTQRTNAQNQTKPGRLSEFLSRNNVNLLRQN